MYKREQLENILFLDIETASVEESFSNLTPEFQALWERKSEILNKREEVDKNAATLYDERAAIFAEFGKVVCISCGFIRFNEDKPSFRLKSFFGADEQAILEEFAVLADSFMKNPNRNLCAHNGKEFDFPYLGRRFLIKGLQMPNILSEIQSRKPWEIRLIDTMHLWKFGDYKSYTSLDLLCGVFGVPSPKEDMDGSQVGHVFWVDKDYERIAHYCERDVLATAQVLLRMSGLSMVDEADVSRA